MPRTGRMNNDSYFVNGCSSLAWGIILALTMTAPVALAAERDQDASVASVGGQVRADLFTGTATTSIPIEVPRAETACSRIAASSMAPPTETAGSAWVCVSRMKAVPEI